MLGMSGLSRNKRLLLGIFILIVVDIIWVVSSEITEYLFHDGQFEKPFFSSYIKTSMFILYLGGFIVYRSWWLQCRQKRLATNRENEDKTEADTTLSEPMYVPTKPSDKSGSDTDDSSVAVHPNRVRFNQLSEVRHISDQYAWEAFLARMSYSAYKQAEETHIKAASKLTVRQVAELAALFGLLFFLGELAYQEALHHTQAGVVNILSSTSGLFTLVLAAIFPSGPTDRFTLSKFVAVVVSICGVVLVSVSDHSLISHERPPLGALWALLGALMYAIYLVLLRRQVDCEDKLNMPMFFGFVGLFVMLLAWPGLLLAHYGELEIFSWPSLHQLLLLIVNGIIGTLVAELLWLWGCFLTSSLLATLSLSLTIPLTMVADTAIKSVAYSWLFYLGALPIFLAFFAVCLLSHYDNWDPVLLALKKAVYCLLSRRLRISSFVYLQATRCGP